MSDATGRLWLVPNTLDAGEAPLQDLLPLGVIQRAASIVHWRVENARSARAFLKRVQAVVPLAQALQALDIQELPRPPKGAGARAADADRDNTWPALLAPARAGHDIGLLSEAGLPAVADPGARLVAAAHAAGIPVLPLPGASSLLLALAASGLNGQSFAFAGYLPQDAVARRTRLLQLQTQSRQWSQTQLVIETPYRNATLLSALLQVLDADTWLAVSSGIGWHEGFHRSDHVAGWRERSTPLSDRVPAVFAFLAR